MKRSVIWKKEIKDWLLEEIGAVFQWLGAPFLEVSIFFEKGGKRNKAIKVEFQPQSYYLTVSVYPRCKGLWGEKREEILRRSLLLELAKIPVWDFVTLVQYPFRTFDEFEQAEERVASLINFYVLNLIEFDNRTLPMLPKFRGRETLKTWVAEVVEFLIPIMRLPKVKPFIYFSDTDDEFGDIYLDFDPKTSRLKLRIHTYFMKNWKEGKSGYLHSAILHELAHLHTFELANALYYPLGKADFKKAKNKLVGIIYYFLRQLRGHTPRSVRYIEASL